MKTEKYKRLYIKEVYMASEESNIDSRMDELVSNWATDASRLHPGLMNIWKKQIWQLYHRLVFTIT